MTLGVSASSFAANMALRQKALEHVKIHPLAARATPDCFYVDGGLMGANSTDEAVQLRKELNDVFERGGFKLQKWNSSERDVLASIPEKLKDVNRKQEIHHKDDEYTKILGIEWNMVSDSFRPMISRCEDSEHLTKRMMLSNIARLFDVLRWCSSAIIQMKILLQRLWQHNLTWDEQVPPEIERVWKRWYKEFPLVKEFSVARPYITPKGG